MDQMAFLLRLHSSVTFALPHSDSFPSQVLVPRALYSNLPAPTFCFPVSLTCDIKFRACGDGGWDSPILNTFTFPLNTSDARYFISFRTLNSNSFRKK